MKSESARPLIAITMGDPAGIGPELVIKALADPSLSQACRPLVIGDPTVLEKALTLVGSDQRLVPIDHPEAYMDTTGVINLICTSNLASDRVFSGPPTQETGKAMEAYIHLGTDLALSGAVQALVTGPITKTGLKMAGSQFHGHTELIAHRTHTANFAMMLAGDTLKVVLVTIHMPLDQVAAAITSDEIMRIIELTHTSLVQRFGITTPKIAVAGLNPHAGEEGMFGHEEDRIIVPTVAKAREKGLDVQGPLPPDTVFYNAVNGRFDAVVCMYHDQGLIPFKMVHFEDGVNTTLGLPIIRTSVDHGTAYDIAWKGIAHADSMIAAIKMAAFQAINQTHGPADRQQDGGHE